MLTEVIPMRLPPEDKGSQVSHEHQVRPDLPSDHPDSLDEQDLLRTSPFPLYGLIGHPSGLTLRGTAYCTAFGHFDTPSGPWQSDQEILWEVSLDYDYLPAHGNTGHLLQLMTTDIQRAPMQASVLDTDEMLGRPRYLAPEDVPLVSAEATSFIVERLPIVDGVVMAAMQYSPNAPLFPGIVKPIRLIWSFTLWNPPLWVEGRAAEWELSELFSVLGKLAIVSQRPDVLRQYERDLQAWDHYIQSNMP
jgi:hypothetical protein